MFRRSLVGRSLLACVAALMLIMGFGTAAFANQYPTADQVRSGNYTYNLQTPYNVQISSINDEFIGRDYTVNAVVGANRVFVENFTDTGGVSTYTVVVNGICYRGC